MDAFLYFFKDGYTALHLAAKYGKEDANVDLMVAGANIHIQDKVNIQSMVWNICNYLHSISSFKVQTNATLHKFF